MSDNDKTEIYVRAPALTMSGYGEQSRFALRALRRADDFEVFLDSIRWGKSSWMVEQNEMREWLTERVKYTAQERQSRDKPYDASLQITVPSELQDLAPNNILFTAGIETDRVHHEWIQYINKFADRVITVSNHSHNVLKGTEYKGQGPDGGQVILNVDKPVDVVNYEHREVDECPLDIEFEHDFNFLAVAQWAPRKNLPEMTEWFLEEFRHDDVGLILKAHIKNNSHIDRQHLQEELRQVADRVAPDRDCTLHVIHGNLHKDEMLGLYQHPDVRAFVTATAGEGAGLPILEAASSGMPVIAPPWSGHMDFLQKDGKSMFEEVDFDLKEVRPEHKWEGTIADNAKWCFPKKTSFQTACRKVFNNYPQSIVRAKKLRKHIKKKFDPQDQYEEFVNSIRKELEGDSLFYSDKDDLLDELNNPSPGVNI